MTTAQNSAPLADQGRRAALTFDRVSMVFSDRTHALDNVSFDVAAGEFVSIVGPSGCGKSTLLRIASGLEPQTAGTCEIDRSSLGYIFQDSTLLPWRTVRRNVELNAELQRMPKAERQQKVREAIKLVHLDGHEAKYPKQLSGGMKMRCSVARALVLNPKVFLFDEPFGALDEITRENLNAELQRLFQIERFAGVFITHSIAEAVFLSTRVIVMSARPGRIIGDYPVPFDFPRAHELRFEPEFAELCGRISGDLKEAHT